MRPLPVLSCVPALFLWPTLATPQATTYGRLTGTVRDPQGGSLPGVIVTLTGAPLLGERTFSTRLDGSYVFRALDPGSYDLRFDLPGFAPLVRRNIAVVTGTTLAVDVALELGGLEETVVVSGQTPVVDVKTTRVGGTFDTTELQDVPSSTDIWAVLAQSPGMRMRGYDVGGSHKIQQTAYDSLGILINPRVLSDGVDSTEGLNGAGLYYDYYSIEEFQVSAAGADVEMSGPGAMVVMTVKGGGNELSGLYHIDYEGESMVGDNTDDELIERGFTGNPNLLLWEAHADLGGPIVKDKAWFYGAYNHFKTDKVISGVDPDVATNVGIFDNYIVKLTFQPGRNDKLIGYSQWSRKQNPTRGLSLLTPAESTRDQDGWSWVHKAEWQRVWSDRLFTNFQLKHFGLDARVDARTDYRTNPPRLDTATGRASGAHADPGAIVRWKPHVSAQANYYVPGKAGSHDFKLGFEWLLDSAQGEAPGSPLEYRDNSLLGRPNHVDAIRLFNTPYGTDNRHSHFDVFVQDIWTISPRVTLTLGARVSRQHVFYEAAELNPSLPEFFPTGSVPGRSLVTWVDVAPRLGAAYDVTGSGKTVLKGYFGRFFVNVGGTMEAANPTSFQLLDYEFVDPNGNGLYDGPDELGSLNFRFAGPAGVPVNPELASPYGDELSVSIEQEIARDTSLRVSYIRKTLEDNYGSWNRAQEIPLRSAGVLCGDALFECPLDPFSQQPLSVARVPDEAQNAQDVAIDTFPGSDFYYDTIQVEGSRRFDERFFLQGSFDYQWRDELKNAGFDLRSPLFSDPIIPDSYVTYWQNHSLDTAHRQPSTTWQARLLGRYVFPADLGVSFNLRHQSGWPWAPIHRVSIPGSGTQPILLEDIDQNRSADVTILDLRLEKSFVAIERYRLTAMLDIYNLANANPETNFVLRTGSSFRSIIAALDPRTLKVGLRWQF